VIINDDAQVSGHRLGVQSQEGARREVGDPQIVDAGRFEGLGGTRNALSQEIATALSVEVVLLQPAINRRQSRQSGIGLFPPPVEQFDGHSREATNLFQDPLLLLSRQSPRFASV
jgi:hypothetical protein